MLELINLVVGCLLSVNTLIYMYSKFSNKTLPIFSIKYWIVIIVMTLYCSISYTLTESIIRIIVTFLLLSSSCLVLYKDKFSKSVIISFVSLGTLLISELIYAMFIVIFLKIDMDVIMKTQFGKLSCDLIIMFTAITLTIVVTSKTKIIQFIGKISDKTRNSFLYILFVSFTNILMLIYCIYFEIDLLLGLTFGVIIVVVYIIFTINLINEKSNNFKLVEENKNMIKSLEEYEKMYAYQRMKNHEYNNDLSILRGMINSKNNKALNYIDKIIGFSKNDNHNWIELLKKIPEGGLQGLLYYKLLQAEEKNINIELNISKKYNSTTYLKLSDELKIKICKLLGIYLDNALQALKSQNSGKLYLNINENNDYLEFKVANTFDTKVDLGLIYEPGYSTKENGNGYGLAIAKQIIDTEKSIENKTSIIKDKFIQEIKIKKQV